MKEIFFGMEGMTLEDLASISRKGVKVQLTKGSQKRIKKARELIEQWVQEEKSIYGVTTGFGALSDVAISKKDTRQLQENILMSHAAGVGDVFDEETVRAVMALRIKDLARGHSGIRLKTVRHLITLLNQGVCPVVPEEEQPMMLLPIKAALITIRIDRQSSGWQSCRAAVAPN